MANICCSCGEILESQEMVNSYSANSLEIKGYDCNCFPPNRSPVDVFNLSSISNIACYKCYLKIRRKLVEQEMRDLKELEEAGIPKPLEFSDKDPRKNDYNFVEE